MTLGMAKLAIVEGVKLFMYENDHPTPHFHALFAEHHAVIDIETLSVVKGGIPKSKLRSVRDWARPRQGRVLQAWALTRAHFPAEPLE